MREFPFPDRENSLQELLGDYVFPKIQKDKIQEIFADAWNVGEEAAREFLRGKKPGEKISMGSIFQEKNVKILEKDVDYIVGKTRYFCEYFSGRDILKIYKKSVLLWCEKNGFSSYEEGLNIILCHEYFHYLEWNEIGLTSRRYEIPMLKLGNLKIGKTGIPSLSEIGANAFADKCFEFMYSDCRGKEQNYGIQERNQ